MHLKKIFFSSAIIFTIQLFPSAASNNANSKSSNENNKTITKTVIFGKPSDGHAKKCRFKTTVVYQSAGSTFANDCLGRKIPGNLWAALNEQIKNGKLQCINESGKADNILVCMDAHDPCFAGMGKSCDNKVEKIKTCPVSKLEIEIRDK